MAKAGGVEIRFLSLLLDLRKKALHGSYSGDHLGGHPVKHLKITENSSLLKVFLLYQKSGTSGNRNFLLQ